MRKLTRTPVAIPALVVKTIQKSVSKRYRKAIMAIVRDILHHELPVSVESLETVLKIKAANLRSATFCEYRKAAIEFADACSWDSSNLRRLVQVDLLQEGQRRPRKRRKLPLGVNRLRALYTTARQRGDETLAAALLIATWFGVRLGELPTLRVVRAVNDEKVFLVVKSAKRTPVRGSNRDLEIPLEHQAIVTAAVNTIHGCNTEQLRKRLYYLDRELYPRHTYRVTIHRIRHQVASDLKASGIDLADLGALLGHRSQKSTEHYGDRRHGKRRRLPGTVQSEFVPRPYEPHAARQQSSLQKPTPPSPTLKLR